MPKYIYLVFIFSIIFCLSATANDYPVPSKGKSGLFGYVDDKGDFIIKPQFEQALPFSEGIARVQVRQHWGLINAKGKFLTKATYEQIQTFRNGVAVVSQSEGTSSKKIVFGLINSKGKEVVTPQYHYFTPSPNQYLFIAGKEEQAAKGSSKINFGVLDATGKVIVPVQFTAIRDLNFKLFAVRNTEDKWQVYSSQGIQLFAGEYSDIKDFDEELATVKKDGKWGIVNPSGAIVVKTEYKDIIKNSKNNYDLVSFAKWRVINGQKETLLNVEYDNLKPLSTTLYCYQSEGKNGLLNVHGQHLCDALYDDIYPFVKELAIVKNGTQYGVINNKGALIVPAQYQAVSIDSATSLIKVKEKGKWGILSKMGKPITPVKYDEIRLQPYAFSTVRQGNLWYLLDAAGKIAGESSYEAIADFTNLYAVVKKHGKSGIINTRGSWVLEPKFDSLQILNAQIALYHAVDTTGTKQGMVSLYTRNILFAVDRIEPMGTNFYRVDSMGIYGMYDCKGKQTIPIKYDYISSFTKDSIVTVEKENKKGLMSVYGKTILRPIPLYQELHVMQNDRVGVKINNKYGFVDRNGKLRIANRYQGIGSFSEDMAAIKIRGRWGFVDKAEELIVQPFYEEVQSFQDGIALVKRDGKWGFVNKKGRETVKPQYDAIQKLATGRYIVIKDQKKGLVNELGKEIYVTKYDFVDDLGNGLILLGKNSKFGIADTKGFDVLPLMYDNVYVDFTKNICILGLAPQIQKFTYSRK